MNADQVLDFSLCGIIKAIREKRLSVTETVNACLKQIEMVENSISALLFVNAEQALAKAREMDGHEPDASRPLWGAPVVIKDALSTKGIPTTAASRILENFIPFYDAYAVQRLKEAGAIIIGKANMDEFAMGSATENSAFQKTRNPWNREKVPGGSSGGSAAAVSSRECFGALGSDTGGSIRQPAAFCGCVGLKPTYGRVSRYGLFAFASSLDQIGPMTKTVPDAALMLSVIAGHDKRDNTSSRISCEDYFPAIVSGTKLHGVTIGLPSDEFMKGIDSDTAEGFAKTKEALSKLGANLTQVKLPDSDAAIATYYIIAMAEASSNLARYDGVRYGRRAQAVTTLDELYALSRGEGFGQEVKRRIMLGSYILSAGYYDAYFKKAAQVRRIIFNQFQETLSECEAILLPVSPVTAWNMGENENDPLKNYLMDAFTLPVNLAGLPAISFPAAIGKHSGMPVGMQLVGRHFAEKSILKFAAMLEKEFCFPPCPL